MNHPIVSYKKGQIVFSAWWIVVMAIHCAIFTIHYSQPLQVALIDGVVWYLPFALFTLGLWYWVRVTDIEKQSPVSIALNHIGAMALALVLMLSAHGYVVRFVFADDPETLALLESMVVAKIVVGALLYILLSTVFYLIFYIHSFREKAAREVELKTLVKDAELNWLKLQLNPHFLFNSLNSISSLTITEPSKAQEMINRLSELLRYSLKQEPHSMVPLKNEVENCRKYLEIEKVRFGKRLEYTLDLPESCEQIKIPAMILQPLFENAIKHSVAQSTEESIITLQSRLSNGGVIISVKNTLPEFHSSKSGMGVGLENIRRRLLLIYGDPKLIQQDKSEDNFTITLNIPKLLI